VLNASTVYSIFVFSVCAAMVKTCAAVGCRNGYRLRKGEAHDPLKLKSSFHSFPLHDKELCNKWVRALHRENFQPTHNSRLCSEHFHSNDFVEESRDTNAGRRKFDSVIKLKKRYLKPNAVPSIFKNLPANLSRTPLLERQTARATSSSRHEHMSKLAKEQNDTFLAADDISGLSLDQLLRRLSGEATFPKGFVTTLLSNVLVIYMMQLEEHIPTITASVTVKQDLVVVISLDGKLSPTSHYSDIVKGPLKLMSQLLNLLARVRSWYEDRVVKSADLMIDTAVDCLRSAVDRLDTDDSTGEELHRRLSFLIEQLELSTTQKNVRQYSPQLIVLSYLTHSASPAAYRTLREQNVLCITSETTLKRLTRRLSEENGLDTAAYLKLRIASLSELQRTVLLMIDEIYIAKRVEYSAGQVRGLTADGTVASTLLCFMIKSLTCKFMDVVAIYPMDKLTAAKQYECYQQVSSSLRESSLTVAAISVDNAATNRRFLTDFLCKGDLTTKIVDSSTGLPIFLIIDPTHDLKNVYNNFQARKIFECPPFDSDLPEGCKANFQHIVDLFNLEENMSLKKAHRLRQSTLHPKSIVKTSVKLAVSIFCEVSCFNFL
jgi:hypothetical protein